MPTLQDVLHAKQTLSARLLRAGLRGGVVGMAMALRVTDAIASAGHNVHAVGVGRKIVEGQPTTQRCVRVYVVQKIAETLLPPGTLCTVVSHGWDKYGGRFDGSITLPDGSDFGERMITAGQAVAYP